jgi:Cu+-exporting ATPase
VRPEELVDAVEAAGYAARLPRAPALGPAKGTPTTELDATADLRRRLVVSAVLSLPVLVLSMAQGLQFDNWQWLALVLATPVVLWGGWPFHLAAWRSLRHAGATMDTLVSLGTLAAWGWSVVALFVLGAGEAGMRMGFDLVLERGVGSDHLYLEVAAVVVTFILAGRYFESRAKRRAGGAIRALMEVGAKEVSILDPAGDERLAPVEELRVGIASSSARARRSPRTAWWRRAARRWIRPYSTARASPSRSPPATRWRAPR